MAFLLADRIEQLDDIVRLGVFLLESKQQPPPIPLGELRMQASALVGEHGVVDDPRDRLARVKVSEG